MSIKILNLIREQFKLNSVKKAISTMSDEEKVKINKVLNFAITWWLKDINQSSFSNNSKDESVDIIYDVVRSEALTEEELSKLENFKHELGFAILKGILTSATGIVELHCGYYPDGILGESIEKSDCQFLIMRVPIKSRMEISKEQVFVKEGYREKIKLAFDVNKTYEFGNESTTHNFDNELLTKGEKVDMLLAKIDEQITRLEQEYIIPSGFVPSNYDFINNYQKNTGKSRKKASA